MKTNCLLLAVIVAGIFNGLAHAQEEADKKASEPETNTKTITAIVGGDVYTVTGEVIRGGTVLVEDDKIIDVGQNISVPEGATVIDATGKVVTPGFVAISMTGIAVSGTPDDNSKLADSLDPYDRNMKFALGVGITTGCVQLSDRGGGRRRGRNGGPEERFLGLQPPAEESLTEEELDFGDPNTSLCPCCGLPVLPTEPITPARPTETRPRKHAVVKMSYGHLDPMLVKEYAFYDLAPGALAGAVNRHNWRRDVNQARKQAKEMAERRASFATQSAARGQSPSGERPTRSSGSRGGRGRGSTNEDLQRLVQKEVALRIQANTVDEIRDMVQMAEELDYSLVIEGAVEGWLVAAELGQAKVPVIFTPRTKRQAQPGREDTSGSSIESTGIFEKSGVPFATSALSSSVSMGGIAGRDLTSLPLEAAFAVRGGASNETALQSLTIVPARMLGLEDRIGSIEKGKDADLLILNGPPLDYRTYVETAIVAGNVSYERDKDRVYPVFQRQ